MVMGPKPLSNGNLLPMPTIINTCIAAKPNRVPTMLTMAPCFISQRFMAIKSRCFTISTSQPTKCFLGTWIPK